MSPILNDNVLSLLQICRDISGRRIWVEGDMGDVNDVLI